MFRIHFVRACNVSVAFGISSRSDIVVVMVSRIWAYSVESGGDVSTSCDIGMYFLDEKWDRREVYIDACVESVVGIMS